MGKLIFVGATPMWKLYDEMIKFERDRGSLLEITGFADDDQAKNDLGYDGFPVLGTTKDLSSIIREHGIKYFAVLFGPKNMALRKEMYQLLQGLGLESRTFIHPKSIRARDVSVGKGCLIAIGVIISQNAIIRDNCCIWAGATVGHDNLVEQHAFIASGAILQGNVRIEENAFIGPGAIITDGISIGSGSIIGAGSVVTKNIPSNMVAYGAPAKVIRKLERPEME